MHAQDMVSAVEVKPSPADCTAFLRRFAPSGPWALTALGDGPGVPTATFGQGQEADLARWVEARQGERRNVYFLVGEARRALSKKAKKPDMARSRWLWVDIDARRDLDWSDAGAVSAEMATLRQRLEDFAMKPTVIVSSGGGYQAFWRLSEPFELGGDAARIGELEALNKALAESLGGDHCHNADRIMRLPGTVNFPDATKAARGRKPTLATLVAVHAGLSYPADAFAALKPAAPEETATEAAALAKLPARLQRMLRAAPAEGDRSSAFFAAACALFEHGLTDAEAAEAFQGAPAGVASKFIERGDLLAEVGRIRGKWKPKKAKAKPAVPDDAEGEGAGANGLVRLALEAAEFFLTPGGETPHAAIRIGGHSETHAVKSRGFSRWLTGLYWEATGRVPKSDVMSDAVRTIEFVASKSERKQVFTRTASHDGRLYLDLGGEDWSAVEVASDGWRVISNPPVHFVRPRGMLPLPTPERGGSIDDLRPFLNLASEDDFVLVVAWLLASLRPNGPFPLLALAGSAGRRQEHVRQAAARACRSERFAPAQRAPRRTRPVHQRQQFGPAGDRQPFEHPGRAVGRPLPGGHRRRVFDAGAVHGRG